MTNNFYIFKNGVCVVNTTPHPVTMQDIDENLVVIPVDTKWLVNAKAIEKSVGENGLYVRTEFVGTPEGANLCDSIIQWHKEKFPNTELVIVGSIIAAQAYPGVVSGLVPVPGYERVAPAEKRMRCDRFTTFASAE